MDYARTDIRGSNLYRRLGGDHRARSPVDIDENVRGHVRALTVGGTPIALRAQDSGDEVRAFWNSIDCACEACLGAKDEVLLTATAQN